MTPERRDATTIEFPSDLEIAVTRDFEAPIQLVFDVFTKPEHMRLTIAPFGERVTECTIDLRVGGDYHYVFVTDDGFECSFRGTYLEIQPPTRIVGTWLFEGWPDAPAVESLDLQESSGVTTVTWKLAFHDQVGRDHMTELDGVLANLENVAAYLRSLDPKGGEAG